MDERSKYVETEDQHEHAESMSPESVDSSLGTTASRQLPPSPAESSDWGENRHPVFFLSDKHINRICSDAVSIAYYEAEMSVQEDRSLGLFGDVTPSPQHLSPQGSLTAGEETSGRPFSGRSASPRRGPLSGCGRRSSSSHSSQKSARSRASSGRRSRGELLSPDAEQRMILAIEEIITAVSYGTPGSNDLGEATPSSSSRRSTPTTAMVASNILTFLLDGTKSTQDAIQSNKLSPEVEKAVSHSLVDSVEASLKRLLTLAAQVPVVVDERDHNPTSHTDLIPGVNMDPGRSSDISDEVTDELATEANATASRILSIIDTENSSSRPSSSRGGSPCPMHAFLASKDLEGFLRSANIRGFSEQLISHAAQILLGSKEAKNTLVRRCSSDTAVDNLTGAIEHTADQFHMELLYSFVEGAVRNLLETFLSLPHSPPTETYKEDYSFMEEKNWVASSNSSCDSSPCWEADDEESLTEESLTSKSSSTESIQYPLTVVIRFGPQLQAENEHDAVMDSEVPSVEGLEGTSPEPSVSMGSESTPATVSIPQTGGQGDSRAETPRTVFEASAVPEHSHLPALQFTPIVASVTDVRSYVNVTTFSSSPTSTTSSRATTPETQTMDESMAVGCCHTFCPCLRQKKAVGPAVKEPKVPKGKSCKGKSSKISVAPVPADAPAAQTSKKPGFARRFAAAALQAFCFGCFPKKVKH